MKKIIRIIEATSDIVSGHFSGWLIVAMMVIVMVEVASRYGFRQPLMISDEFSAYMMVALGFMALAYAWRNHTHVRIEVVTSRLRPRARNWLRLVTVVIALIFVPVLTKSVYDLIAFCIAHGERSPSWVRTPIALPQIFMFIGAALLCLQLIVELIYAVRALRSSEGGTLRA